MDWTRYRSLCDRPDVMTRWALERTLTIIDASTGKDIERLLGTRPIPKPADHKGGPETDCFFAEFELALVDAVLDSLDVGNDSQLRHLAVVWAEYREAADVRGGTIP